MPKFDRSLFVFRRDLRLEDNSALLQALESSKHVVPAFILDPRQLKANPYAGEPSISFMRRSLEELDVALRAFGSRLCVFQGEAHHVVATLLQEGSTNAVYLNVDYTPFSRARDLSIKEVCAQYNVTLVRCHDSTLIVPEESLKQDGKPYTVYTPFKKNAAKVAVRSPRANPYANYYLGPKLAGEIDGWQDLLALRGDLAVSGGRREALTLLERVPDCINYKEDRDFPALSSTSRLSAHNKFGTLSIREFYAKVFASFGKDHTLISELYWRDFFTQIAFYFPHVFGGCFHRKYDQIEWHDKPDWFERWCLGETGFPIVDAGMRELNRTGLMHNRVRMVVASFLTKDLHLDWRLGERYFANKLVDYDPAVNNGNWQWSASTGCDAQPYFRIFNPWLQQQRFDPECKYIKQWVPELAGLSAKSIHRLYEARPAGLKYAAPIVEHAEEKQLAEEMFSELPGAS